jgi:putative chitinase
MSKIQDFVDGYSSKIQENINIQVEKQEIYKTARVQAIAITELNTSGWPTSTTTTIGQLLAYIFPKQDATIFEPNLPDDTIGGITVNPVYLNVIAILNGNQASPTTKELYNKLDKNCNAKLLIDNYNRAKDFGGQKWFDNFMSSALKVMNIDKIKMSDFKTLSTFEDSFDDLIGYFNRNFGSVANNYYTDLQVLYDAFIEAGENYNQPVGATQSGTQSQSDTQSTTKTSDYKIIVKDPKTDNDKIIEGSISFSELGPDVTANSVLNNLPNPWTDVRTNLPVPDNTGTITYESFPFSKSTDNYEKILADDSIKVLQTIIADKYGVEILLTYDPVNLTPAQSSPTQSEPTTATSSVTSATASGPREYTFDVQIENTFYNSEIGYLTITGKVDDTFIYGDEQDTIDPEYLEETFIGEEEELITLEAIDINALNDIKGFDPENPDPSISTDAGSPYPIPKNKQANIAAIVAAMKKKQITNKFAQAAILAVVSKESAFVPQNEASYAKTSASRIKSIFSKFKKYSDSEVDRIKKIPKEFFDIIYGGKYGNASDEGYKYRGRGFNQLTFKKGYQEAQQKTGHKIVTDPDLVNTIQVAADCLVVYFLQRMAEMPSKFKTQYNFSGNINDFKTLNDATGAIYHANAGWGNSYSLLVADSTGGRKKAFKAAPSLYNNLA